MRRRRRRAARSHGRAPLPGTLRAVAAAGAEPDPRGARCGRAEGHSPPPQALAAPGAAPSPPPLGLPPRAERGRMTELQSALLLRRQLAGSRAGGRRGGEGRRSAAGGGKRRGGEWRPASQGPGAGACGGGRGAGSGEGAGGRRGGEVCVRGKGRLRPPPRRSPAQPGAEGTRPRGGGGACLAIAARGAGGRGAEGRHGGGERFLRCPRPVREVGVGNGPARRCRVPPFPHPPTPPPCAWQPPRSLLRPCLPGARRGGGREKGARAFLPAAWGICAGKSPWCEGMFVRPRQEAEEGEFPHPPGNGTSGPG